MTYQPLYDKYEAAISLFVRTLIKDQSRAIVITAETFRRLGEKINDFDNENQAKAFLYTSARDMSLDWMRRRKRELFNDIANGRD